MKNSFDSLVSKLGQRCRNLSGKKNPEQQKDEGTAEVKRENSGGAAGKQGGGSGGAPEGEKKKGQLSGAASTSSAGSRSRDKNKIDRDVLQAVPEGPITLREESWLQDLPEEMRDTVIKSNLGEIQQVENLVLLLHCLHFRTHRCFIFHPATKTEEGEGEEKGKQKENADSAIDVLPTGQEGGITQTKPIHIQGNRRDVNWNSLPPIEELVSSGDIKKEYKVMDEVGQGGFGKVFKAKKLKSPGQGIVAIKKMPHTDKASQYNNFREVLFLKQLHHANIVKYHCCWTVEEELWLVTEFMEGGTLTQACKKEQLEEREIAYVAREMLNGIAYLHAHDCIHRDLKSANIMLTTQGDVKLIDFGLCIDIANEPKRMQRGMVGSPYWMPPEMIRQEPYGPEVDIWSFAMCLLELINRRTPNRDIGGLAALYKVATEGVLQPYKKPEAWSTELKDFVSRCLQTNPDLRATPTDLLNHIFIKRCADRKAMKGRMSMIFLSNSLNELGW